MDFTIEQENMACIFDVSSRTALINSISAALPEFDDPELLEIAETVLHKLQDITDVEFSALVFNPAYFNYDDETEA